MKYNLSFSGSGLLFPAHVGAYTKFVAEKYAGTTPAEISGTSGGSLIAALISAGFSVEEIIALIHKHDFHRLLSFEFRGLWKGAYTSGRRIEALLQQLFGNTVLSDLAIPIHIPVSNVDMGRQYIFSSETHAQERVVDVLMASIAIPLVLPPRVIDGVRYIDGMLFNNMPFNVFSNNLPTFGFHLLNETVTKYDHSPWALPSYLFRVFSMITRGLNKMHIELDKLDANSKLYFIDASGYTQLGNYPSGVLFDLGYSIDVD